MIQPTSACDTRRTVVAGIKCATRVGKSGELCTITSSFLLIAFCLATLLMISSESHGMWQRFHETVPLTH